MRHSLIFGFLGMLGIGGCAKDDPQAMINQWNAEFAALKSACDAGDQLSCRVACQMTAEHRLCTTVSQAADMNDPLQRTWVEGCVQNAAAQGRAVCLAAGSVGVPPVAAPAVTAPVIAEPNAALEAAEQPSVEAHAAVAALSSFEKKGELSQEVIRRIVRRHINEVKFCYEKGLSKQPKLAGLVVVKFIISGTGAVQMSAIEKSTLSSPAVEACVAAAVRRWTFPTPKGGGIVVVSYPFEFKFE